MRLSLTLLFFLLLNYPTKSWAAFEDTRPLTATETNSFMPLVCAGAMPAKGKTQCSQFIGYPPQKELDAKDNAARVAGNWINFSSIGFDSFTHTQTDQAYITYTSSLEPHALNWGGGILFEKQAGAWTLVRWYPGGQRDDCLMYDVSGTQHMLCSLILDGQNANTTYSQAYTATIPDNNNMDEIYNSIDTLVAGEDSRHADSSFLRNYACRMKRSKDESLLLRIGKVSRSQQSGYIAEAPIEYAKSADITAACKEKHFDKVKTTPDIVYFKLERETVNAVTPTVFAKRED